MLTDITYIIATQICFAVLWIFYVAVLRRRHTFTQNRFYLLSMAFTAFIIPLLEIPVYIVIPENIPTTVETTVGVPFATVIQEPGISITEICKWLYLAGVAAMITILTYNAIKIWRIRRHAKIISTGKISVLRSDTIQGSFTFINSIFINTGGMDKEAVKQVLTHEISHVRMGHYKDLILAQGVLILFWWNPFVWLWMRSLKEVHEFQADEAVLKNCNNSELYISLMLKGIADIHPEFVSGFSYSLIKNRLTMITRQNKKRFAKFRILLSLPVLAGLLICFSFTDKPSPDKTANTNADTATTSIIPPHSDILTTTDTYTVNNQRMATIRRDLDGCIESLTLYDKNNNKINPNDLIYILDGKQISYADIHKINLNFASMNSNHESDTVYFKSRPNAIRDGITETGNKNTVYILDGKKISTKEAAKLNPQAIQSISRYGDKNMVVITSNPTKNNPPFLICEIMPTFQGSNNLQGFQNWVMQQMKYPQEAAKNGIQGKVIATFIIEKDGSLNDIEILQSPDKSLSNEIIRVLKQSPKWTPGTQRGEKVRVKYTTPFEFRLK